MEKEVAETLAVLGHPQRLALFRLLMRRYPDRLPAGEIAQILGLKPSTLSAYLAALMQVGLLGKERVGTSLLYSIEMGAVRETFGFLLDDCCRGRVSDCLPAPASTTPRRFRVLFVCTGNSARSLMAEALLRALSGDRFEVHSAGTHPASGPNPQALALLEGQQHGTSGLYSKDFGSLASEPPFDFVFTVCDRAANEECPALPGHPVSGHWGVPDPVIEAARARTPAEAALAFRAAYGALRNRIEAFAALPFETLDRRALQSAVDDIARYGEN
ncbi:helix-turn-helix domain-containing protein [Thioclava sp. 'Guangxiensis']|uniref:arsenate reductase/protein-tyrosine-phosphatase family protein n=1 Tax=Thioclava sp. 'Guangxiensis' TaxID=3149044 RepID=UPI003877D199